MSDPMARYVQFCAGLLEAVSALLDVDPAPVPTQPEPQPLWINVAATLEMHAFIPQTGRATIVKSHCRCGHTWPDVLNARSAWGTHVAPIILAELAKVNP